MTLLSVSILILVILGVVSIWIFGLLRGAVTWLIGDVIVGVSFFVGGISNFLVGLIVFAILTALFIRNGIGQVPSYPPHKAIMVFWGKRLNVVLGEGYHWFPGYPFLFNFIRINMLAVNQDLNKQVVRTPDLAEIEIEASITWVPGIKIADTEEYDPESFITYLNRNAGKGVMSILSDIIEDRLRTWAVSNQEGPSDWIEAMGSKPEAVEVITRAILGDDVLPRIPSELPTVTWMKFFARPQQKPSKNEIKMGWADEEKDADGVPTGKFNWDKLQEIFNALPAHAEPLDLEAGRGGQEDIRNAVRQRQEDIRELQRGNGHFGQSALGITIIRFSIQKVKVIGKTAEAAELKRKEQHEKDAEAVEIQNVRDRIKELILLGLSAQEAMEAVQVERHKVTKTIDEKKISFSQQTIEGIQKVVSNIIEKTKP